MRNEPERTGWARMYDLVREYDKGRVSDNKEDIDTLLVFVSPSISTLGVPNSTTIGWFVLGCRHSIHYRVVQKPSTTT